MSDQTTVGVSYKQKRFRSPPYPALSLGKAIGRAKELYDKAQHHVVPMHVLANAWGYTTKSSAIHSTSAALKHYGLLNDTGSGDKRRYNLTEQALRIIKDPVPNSPKRMDALKRAALAPKVHSELWEQYGLAGLSGSMDPTLLSYLTIDKQEAGFAPYSDTAAQEVISVYKETVGFAGLGQNDILPDLEPSDHGTDHQVNAEAEDLSRFGGARVGDLVQWESSGQLKFEGARKVRAVTTHEGREWVFVDQTEVGIPMAEVVVEKRGDVQTGGGDMAPPVLPLEQDGNSNEWKELTRLDSGYAEIRLPENFTEDGYSDLEIWLESILRKAARRAGIEHQRK